MKRQLLTLAAAAAVAMPGFAVRPAASAKKAKNDPIVMTVNGKDVPQSEFLYLFNKNNSQQATPQSIDDYVDMFVVYKLKVAAAEDAGLDTVPSFRTEFEGYCADLSAPYLKDTVVERRLMDDAYRHARSMRRASHILMAPGKTLAEDAEVRARMDSIRTAIAAGADFAELARKYSIDRSAVMNGGDLGYIRAGQFPYLFEEAVYNTPVGELSGVVEDMPYGYHIIKVVDERQSEGEVSARHILKLTQGLSPEDAAAQKAAIDSIAALLAAGADFETLAREQSEDPGSAARGGNLGFFGRGVMVPEFEEAAFSLQPGEISAPFATSYGWHIVQTLEYKPFPPMEEMKDQLSAAMERDGRSQRPRQAYLASLREQLGAKVDEAVVEHALQAIAAAPDGEAAVAAIRNDNSVIIDVDGNKLVVADLAGQLNPSMPTGNIALSLRMIIDDAVDNVTLPVARRRLVDSNEEYRNLVNEYRDGMLLFEVANRNVWARAADDRDVQNEYFAANRSKYTWDKPRYKGCVVFATNDSIAREARKYLAENFIAADTLARTVFKRFDGEVKLERVLVAKGDNAIIDEIAFGGKKADPVGKWTTWFPFQDKVLYAPEEAADVRAAVIGDLQQQLEAGWVDSLREKYPVKINKKVLEKLKKK